MVPTTTIKVTTALGFEPLRYAHVAPLMKGEGWTFATDFPGATGDRLLGTLLFASRGKDRFDDEEVAIMETICHYVTVACERLRLGNELKEAGLRKDE